MNINEVREGYIVVPHPAGYQIFKLSAIEECIEHEAFGSFQYWFSGTATYAAIVNTAKCTTPEEIVALIEEQEKRNGRKGINDSVEQGRTSSDGNERQI